MQRITWNGVAMHGGPLPGYAASHGCVRMPYRFAEKLFDKTRMGMRVIISPNDAAPVEFSHPVLLMPNAKALAAAPAQCRDARAARRRRPQRRPTRQRQPPRERRARRHRSTASLRKLKSLKTRADAELAARRQGDRRGNDGPSQGAGRGAEAEGRRQGRGRGDAARGRPGRGQVETRRRRSRKGRRSRRPRPGRPPPPRRRTTRSSRSNRSRSSSAARRRKFTSGATRTSRGRTGARCSTRPSRLRSRSAIPTNGSARMCSPRWRATTRACAGPRSRSTTGMSAKNALDRITIPQDVLDRIAPTALPRSSIVVSDEPLSTETNYRTEFVAVLSNQPQGGFITRKPTTTSLRATASGAAAASRSGASRAIRASAGGGSSQLRRTGLSPRVAYALRLDAL